VAEKLRIKFSHVKFTSAQQLTFSQFESCQISLETANFQKVLVERYRKIFKFLICLIKLKNVMKKICFLKIKSLRFSHKESHFVKDFSDHFRFQYLGIASPYIGR